MEEYFKNNMDKIGQYFQDSTKEFFMNMGKKAALFIFESSDLICPIVCLIALAFYIGGSKKAGRVVSFSFVFYFIACTLRKCIK